MFRKSRLMAEAEARIGRPLEEYLAEEYPRLGLVEVAKTLGVHHSTVWYWLLKFGFQPGTRTMVKGPARRMGYGTDDKVYPNP